MPTLDRDSYDPIEIAIRGCSDAAVRVMNRIGERPMQSVPDDIPELEEWRQARAKLSNAMRRSGKNLDRAGPTIERAGKCKANEPTSADRRRASAS